MPLFSLIEAATAVHKCAFVLVYELPQFGDASVWIEATYAHLIGATIWFIYDCPKDGQLLQQEGSSSFVDCFV